MKLKNILGIAIFASAMFCAVPAFAAEVTYNVGKPIDLTTGAETDTLKAGQKLVYPVDIVTDSQIQSYQIYTKYDNTILTPGITDSSLTDAEYANAAALGEVKTVSGVDGAIFSMGEKARTGFSAYGVRDFNLALSADECNVGWYDSVGRTVNADTPEFYMMFTVKADVDDNALNKTIITADTEHCLVGIYGGSPVGNVATNDVKANACYAAFNVNIDSSALPYWIQKLSIKVGDNEAVQIKEYTTTDNVNYTFPVRITTNSASATSVNVSVIAQGSNDEAGTVNVKDYTMGSFTAQLNSPSEYANPTME